MARYTEEELLKLKPTVAIPVNFDFEEFNAIINKVKEIQALQEEEYHSFHRRRSSHHHGRPKIKHTKPKITTDADGWSTLEAAAGRRKSSVLVAGGEEEAAIRETLTAVIANETLRVKPNNKNISSSRPADTRDIVADKPTMNFNAFAALESDEESDQ